MRAQHTNMQDAFEALLDEHRKILYKVANFYRRDLADRDDIAHGNRCPVVALLPVLRRSLPLLHLDVPDRLERRDFLFPP
jgi:hypothetical protein